MQNDKNTTRVLFLCTGNSARSVLAEALLNHLGEGRFEAFSAGSQPKGDVHPSALEVLKAAHIDTDGLRSKSWDEFGGDSAVEFDFIFTVCDSAAAETCPIWPGHPMTIHWGIADPAAVDGTKAKVHAAFLDAYRRMKARIERFIELPLDQLAPAQLKTELRMIGALND